MTGPNSSVALLPTSGASAEPAQKMIRSELVSYFLITSSPRLRIRCSIVGTTTRVSTWWRSIVCSVASGSNRRRSTVVEPIPSVSRNCESPVPWNSGAASIVRSLGLSGIRSMNCAAANGELT